MELEEAISEIKENSDKNFTQTLDLIVNLRHVDVDKNPIDLEIQLPNGRGKELNIGIIADRMLSDAKDVTDYVISKDEIETIDDKELKKMADECDFFLAEASCMPLVGKHLGQVLGPRGKMPKPLPPDAPVKEMAENLQNTIKLEAKKFPMIQTVIGTEDMSDEELQENLSRVLEAVESDLPRGKEQIKKVLVKPTMGSTVEIDY